MFKAKDKCLIWRAIPISVDSDDP